MGLIKDHLQQQHDLLYNAWAIIANVNEGNWDNETPEWKAAATKWRDQFHEYLHESDDLSYLASLGEQFGELAGRLEKFKG